MSLHTFTKPVHGPSKLTRHDLMGIRYFFPPVDDGPGGGGGEYVAPASQADLDRIIGERVTRERAKYGDYDELKEKASKWTAHEQANAGNNGDGKGGGKTDTPNNVTPDDVQSRIDAALAERDRQHAIDLSGIALGKALETRTYDPTKLLNLDRSQFVKDGKFDQAAVDAWVQANTQERTAEPRTRRMDPGQGNRDATAAGGTTQSGRDRYSNERSKNKP